MKFFSYGGGVQSTAVLVLQAQGQVQYDEFIFSNVGDDSENPATIRYLNEYALPFAQAHGIKLTVIDNKRTLYNYLNGDNRSIAIPAYLSGRMPGNRTCTVNFKIRLIARYIRRTYGISEWTVGLGISTDEIHRARIGDSLIGKLVQHREYPLIDLRLSRHDCQRIISEAGLPIPPKSSCWFCPFHRPAYWKEMRADDPATFEKAIALEQRINQKREAIGRDMVYLHPSLKPLAQAVDEQMNFFDELANCESGYCMV